MLPKKHGCIVFTGASASVKGYALSAAFAMGKFALRGLAQSMSRELHPKGIHVAHVMIDGGIKSERRPEPPGKTASLLNPTSIAASYLHLIHQPHSAWSSELELRPWVEIVLSEGCRQQQRASGTVAAPRTFPWLHADATRGDDDEEIAFDDDCGGGVGRPSDDAQAPIRMLPVTRLRAPLLARAWALRSAGRSAPLSAPASAEPLARDSRRRASATRL